MLASCKWWVNPWQTSESSFGLSIRIWGGRPYTCERSLEPVDLSDLDR